MYYTQVLVSCFLCILFIFYFVFSSPILLHKLPLGDWIILSCPLIVNLDSISCVKPALIPQLGVFPSCSRGSGYFLILITNSLFICFSSHRHIKTCVLLIVSPTPRTVPDIVFDKSMLCEAKKKRWYFSLCLDLPDKMWLWVYQQLGARTSVKGKGFFKPPQQKCK